MQKLSQPSEAMMRCGQENKHMYPIFLHFSGPGGGMPWRGLRGWEGTDQYRVDACASQ